MAAGGAPQPITESTISTQVMIAQWRIANISILIHVPRPTKQSITKEDSKANTMNGCQLPPPTHPNYQLHWLRHCVCDRIISVY